MASEEGIPNLPDAGDSIDHATFEQILEMDDEEDDREFSRSIVFGFFEQAEQTFDKMDEEVSADNLKSLSSLGHFLKGSSATLGLVHIKQSCEKIQHWGACKDAAGSEKEDPDKCLEYIKKEIPILRKEYAKIEKVLKKFYGET